MDAVSFDTWLGAICLLTACQRQEGFMSLALAEADDEAASVRIDAPPMSVGGVCCAPDGTALAIQITVESDPPPAPASASAAAQSRAWFRISRFWVTNGHAEAAGRVGRILVGGVVLCGGGGQPPRFKPAGSEAVRSPAG